MTRSDLFTWFAACALAALLVTCTASCVPEADATGPDAGEVAEPDAPMPDLDVALGAWDVVVDASACDAGELRVAFDLGTHRGVPIVVNGQGTAWLGAGVTLRDDGARVWIQSPILGGTAWYIELDDNGVHTRARVWLDVAGCEVVSPSATVAWRERTL